MDIPLNRLIMEHIATCTLPSRLSSASWKKEKHIFVSCHAKRVLELNTGTCEFWCISLYVTGMSIPWKILPALVSIYILHATEKVDWIKSILCSLCNIKNTDYYHSSLFLPSSLQHQWNFHQLYSLLKMPTLCFLKFSIILLKGPTMLYIRKSFQTNETSYLEQSSTDKLRGKRQMLTDDIQVVHG